MAGDIVETLKELDIDKTILIGHSMGGRVAMETAFATPSLVEKLILVDITPLPSPQRVDMVSMVLTAMINLDLTQIKSRKDANILLKESIPVSISCLGKCTIQHACFTVDYQRKGLTMLAKN